MPTITVNTNAGTNYEVTSATPVVYKGIANKSIDKLKNIGKLRERIKFTYVYTKTSGTKFTTELKIGDRPHKILIYCL